LALLGTSVAPAGGAGVHSHPGAYVGHTDKGNEVRFGHSKNPSEVYNFAVIRNGERHVYFRHAEVKNHHFAWSEGDYESRVEVHGHWVDDTHVHGRINVFDQTKKFRAHVVVHGPGD
jgi:hypothetical protein